MLQNFIMKNQKFQILHTKQATEVEVPLMKGKIRGKIIKNSFPTKMVQPISFTYIICVNVTRDFRWPWKAWFVILIFCARLFFSFVFLFEHLCYIPLRLWRVYAAQIHFFRTCNSFPLHGFQNHWLPHIYTYKVCLRVFPPAVMVSEKPWAKENNRFKHVQSMGDFARCKV